MDARPKTVCRAAALVIAAAGCLLPLAGCGPTEPAAPAICDSSKRTELLNTRLDALTPSQTFTVRSGSTGWIQLTTLPASYEGLFGHAAGDAELHSVHSGVPPNLVTTANGYQESRDPSIIISSVGTWQQLPMGPGDWQLYSFSNPGIDVASCPAS